MAGPIQSREETPRPAPLGAVGRWAHSGERSGWGWGWRTPYPCFIHSNPARGPAGELRTLSLAPTQALVPARRGSAERGHPGRLPSHALRRGWAWQGVALSGWVALAAEMQSTVTTTSSSSNATASPSALDTACQRPASPASPAPTGRGGVGAGRKRRNHTTSSCQRCHDRAPEPPRLGSGV